MIKRYLSAVLTLALLCSLLTSVCLPASAADKPGYNRTMEQTLYAGNPYEFQGTPYANNPNYIDDTRIAEGTVPPGMTFEGSDESWNVSGTPTKAGVYRFVIEGYSSDGWEKTTCTFTVVESQVEETYLCEQGRSFKALLPVRPDGTTIQSCTLVYGSLPQGLKLQQAPGAVQITGTPDKKETADAVLHFVMADGTEVYTTVHVAVFTDAGYDTENLVLYVGKENGSRTLSVGSQDTDVKSGELTSGQLPPGVDWKLEGGAPVLTGTPKESGQWKAVFRFLLSDDSLLTYTVGTTAAVLSEQTVTLTAGESLKSLAVPLDPRGFGIESVRAVSGEIPAGLKLMLPGSGPYLTGTPEKAGTQTVTMEAVRKDGSILHHTIMFEIRKAADSPAEPPAGDHYVFPFRDVAETDWFYTWVKSAHRMGLIDGMSPETFGPGGNMTYAQAITLAARMNQKYETGAVTLENGSVHWYDSYVDYCLEKGIISRDYSGVINSNIDRQTYVDIFSRALPASQFAERNSIPAGSLPDVSAASPCCDSIYLFYRAGILNGSKPDGTFNPTSSIKRSEVAAILVRMMDASCRVDAPADLNVPH